MQDFRITQIDENAYSILDAGDSSWYVIEGEDRAAVIDTGVSPGLSIMPVVRKLTSKPPILVVTHRHIDHMYHLPEFDTAYMCHDEFLIPEKTWDVMFPDCTVDVSKTIDIQDDSVIDLGGEKLLICKVPGHTPGSVVVLDEKRQLLFTGDAIGSGYGVWMQVPSAISLEEYYISLMHLFKWLVDHGGRMHFYGGHNYQQFQSTLIPNYNPLNMGLLADLIDLVDGLVRGTIIGRASNADKVMSLEPALYASFGRAEIQYAPSRIHKAVQK
jgi:hydroxyacylglutathione hydrolase